MSDIIRVDKETGMLGRATELPNGRMKLVPYNQEHEGGIEFIRDPGGVREVSPDDTLYALDVAFENEGECYGEFEIHLVADNDDEAEERARRLAEKSTYDDDRIPDRRILVSAYEILDDLKCELESLGGTGMAP